MDDFVVSRLRGGKVVAVSTARGTNALYEHLREAIERGDLPAGETIWPDKWPQMKEVLMGDQQPSVGRIVHYQEADDCLAAIIAGVNDDGTVNLSYFARTGGHRQVQNVSEDAARGAWHWPERM